MLYTNYLFPQEKVLLNFGHAKIPLLINLVRSRYLDIGHGLL